jgi:hypothetical protein
MKYSIKKQKEKEQGWLKTVSRTGQGALFLKKGK